MSPLLKMVSVVLIAVVGFELIAMKHGDRVSIEDLKLLIPFSIVVWAILALMLRDKPIWYGLYAGFLSPFLGGLFAFPPYGVFIALTNVAICVGVGVTTGVMVSLVTHR